jgi:hypothetical protein
MDQDKSIREAAELAARVWRQAAVFFMSIEVGLLLATAFITVGGVFLAFMGDLRCLLAFGFVIAYFSARPILHFKGILRWPFL